MAVPPPLQEDATRNLWDTGFLQKRPGPTGPGRARKTPRYKRATPPVAAGRPRATDAVVGVTIWRLRPSAAPDESTARLLVHEPGTDLDEAKSWTPERVDVGTVLEAGQRVRLSVEAPRAGFLYVIDREKYQDGSHSTPRLIFPTLRTRGGDNAVSAGSVVEVPAQRDNPIFFTLERSRPDHVAELITIIVAPKKLEGVTIGNSPVELARGQVADWEARWGAGVERITLEGGVGQAYTPAEKTAGADPGAQLTQDDPLPQTIYRVAVKPGDSILVTVPLPIGGKGRPRSARSARSASMD
jgi:hypothetical protein